MSKIDCHFSGSSNLVKIIYDEMLQAKNVVFVAIFTLTNDTLINGLIELRKKGVKILAIFDHIQATILCRQQVSSANNAETVV